MLKRLCAFIAPAAALACFAGALLLYIKKGEAGLFPLICACIMVPVCVLTVKQREYKQGCMRVLPLMGLCALFCLAIVLKLSFYIAAPIFVFCTSLLISSDGMLKSALLALAVSPVCYVIFELLFGVVLP